MTTKVNKKLRNNEYYNFQEVLDNLYAKAKNKNFKINKLYDLIVSEQNILLAISNLKSNSGSRIPGTDKLTIDHYLKMKYSTLLRLIRNKMKDYQPRKIRRVNTPKDSEGTRNLGIPCVIDRIIQMMFLNVLEPICEAKFHPHSYGFRPNRSAEHALANFNMRVNRGKLYHVVNIDIKSFFDNINHGKLLKQIWSLGIQDKKVISIISKMLKSKVLGFENLSSEQGTLQGGILSPLLSNIVLNELDWWVSSQWENFPVTSAKPLDRGFAIDRGDCYRSLRTSQRSQNMKECYIVRYADDFNILCRKRSDAVKMFHATKDFLKSRLYLEINEEKSKIVNLKRKSIDFLGFKIRTKRQKAKKTDIVVQTNIRDKKKKIIKERLKKEYKELNKIQNHDDLVKKICKLNSFIIGIHNYFQFATNINLDFSKINFETMKTGYGRLQHRLKKTGTYNFKENYERYGKSKQTRWIEGLELLPVAYVQHKNPMNISNKINKYTEEGRKAIHKKLKPEVTRQIHFMQSHPIQNQSIEYNTNRITKYSIQKGKCSVLGDFLLSPEVHCHHIIPKKLGGKDDFDNLIVLHEDIHRLIHLVDLKKIEKVLKELELTSNQIKKVNELRKKCNLEEI